MSGCNNGTVIPTDNTPLECEEFINSNCIIFQDAITYLDLPPDSNITVIFTAMLASLVDARNRIEILENNI